MRDLRSIRTFSLFLLLACAGAASAEEPSAASGNDAGTQVSFDFGMPDLNFETRIPPDAKAETVKMDAVEPGAIAKVKLVGTVTPGKSGPPVKVVVMAYDMHGPAAMRRICNFEAEIAGYTPRSTATAPDLTEAKVLATASDNGRPKSALLSHCFARGNQALAIHFIGDVVGEPTPEAAQKVLDDLDGYATSFLGKLHFSNGRQASFGEDLQSVPLRIGDARTDLRVPAGWGIPINDFQGPLPAELHMIRRSKGKDVGLVWLSIQEMKERPDIEVTGTEIVRSYFVKQSPDAEMPVILVSGEDRSLSERGLANRQFQFSARNRKGEDIGTIQATVVWHEGRLIVISGWSTWADKADRNTFFSRLPDLTAYDIVRSAVLAEPG